jgi:hypothetical protein
MPRADAKSSTTDSINFSAVEIGTLADMQPQDWTFYGYISALGAVQMTSE